MYMKRNIKIICITPLEMVKNIGGVFIMLNVMLCFTFIVGTILLFILLSYSSILN